jgi:rRNA maturation protein Rpf1
MPYITTSRNVKQNTRRLARSFCSIFLNFTYENRGKKNFDSVAKRALKLGYKSILFLYESHGNPSLIEKVELTDKDEWEIVEKICFNAVKIEKAGKDYTKNNIEFQGDIQFFKDLIEYEEPVKETKDKTVVKYANKFLSIRVENKEIISLKLI